MSRRVLVGFVILNVIVSLSVAVIIISLEGALREDPEPIVRTEAVIYTASPDPNQPQVQDWQATISKLETDVAAGVRVVPVTATPESSGGISIPQDATVATLKPTLFTSTAILTALAQLDDGTPGAVDGGDGDDVVVYDDGCPRYTVQANDTLGFIADQYDVLVGDLMDLNDIDDPRSLQIDQELIIPVEGCSLLYTPTPAPTVTRTPFDIDVPSVTPPPTAANAQVTITAIDAWGDVNNEVVKIRNQGAVVNLQGWTLSDADGNTFLFPELRLRRDSQILVYSRLAENTSIALYWGQEGAVWSEGEVATLANAAGSVQATFRVGSAAQPTSPPVTRDTDSLP
jgi:LysM repeat protein